MLAVDYTSLQDRNRPTRLHSKHQRGLTASVRLVKRALLIKLMINPDPPGTGARSSRAIPQMRRLSIIACARLFMLLMLLMLLAACDQAPSATSSPPATPSLGAQTA